MELTIKTHDDPNVKKYELWSRGKVNMPFRFYDHVLIPVNAEDVKKKYLAAFYGKCIPLENAIKKYDGVKLFVGTMADKIEKPFSYGQR